MLVRKKQSSLYSHIIYIKILRSRKGEQMSGFYEVVVRSLYKN